MFRIATFASSIVASIPIVLPLAESGVGQPLQRPREDRFMRLEGDAPPRARHRRVVRRGFVERDIEELPKAPRIGGPPGNRPFGIEPFEVAPGAPRSSIRKHRPSAKLGRPTPSA